MRYTYPDKDGYMGNKKIISMSKLREYVRDVIREELELASSRSDEATCAEDKEHMMEAGYGDDDDGGYSRARDRLADKMSRRDDGWSGERNWGGAADEELGRRAIKSVERSGMGGDEDLRRRAIDSLSWSGEKSYRCSYSSTDVTS
jgi:hypothetical protein